MVRINCSIATRSWEKERQVCDAVRDERRRKVCRHGWLFVFYFDFSGVGFDWRRYLLVAVLSGGFSDDVGRVG